MLRRCCLLVGGIDQSQSRLGPKTRRVGGHAPILDQRRVIGCDLGLPCIKRGNLLFGGAGFVAGRATLAKGCLYLGADGDMQFAYDAAWLADASAPALSFSLPKQAEPFKRRACVSHMVH